MELWLRSGWPFIRLIPSARKLHLPYKQSLMHKNAIRGCLTPCYLLLISCCSKKEEIVAIQYDTELLQRVRATAAAIPGSLPPSIGYIKYA
jgi:hypothetical protein